MAQLTVRAGRAYMVTSPEREAALSELRDSLGKGGVAVDLEITHYEPGRRGLPAPSFPEEVAIFIGTGVGSGLVGAIVTDIYNKTKQWATKRYEAKRRRAQDAKGDSVHVKGERFTIYGPDGNVLKTWTVDKDGEHETEGGWQISSVTDRLRSRARASRGRSLPLQSRV